MGLEPIADFTEAGNKLAAPTKKSLFEKQKADAEAKRQREARETAAVYEDFVKSFDDDTGDDGIGYGRQGPSGSRDALGKGSMGGSTHSQRHFGTRARGGFANSGPGSLGPPPMSSRKKLQEAESFLSSRNQTSLGFERHEFEGAESQSSGKLDSTSANDGVQSDHIVPKPTLRLSNLPPGTSPSVIKSLIPSTLSVEDVQVSNVSGKPRSADRPSMTAIITLSIETATVDIDTTVSKLQRRYLGRGHYLSLSRHLSSTTSALDSTLTMNSSSLASLPFGAKPTVKPGFGSVQASTLHRGGYAPPSSMEYSAAAKANMSSRATPYQIAVKVPTDLREIRMIHRCIEGILDHGVAFEAVLMDRPEVQMEEKWAWIWDPQSKAGVYYRWKLWTLVSGWHKKKTRASASMPQHIFDDGIPWVPPDVDLQFEFVTRMDEFVSHPDYHSSDDEDDSGDEGRRRFARFNVGERSIDMTDHTDEQSYLNPLLEARLVHLLGRLPPTIAKLRRGDVMRITAFAIEHASASEEIVNIVTANVLQPFSQPPSRSGTDSSSSKNHEDRMILDENLGNAKIDDEDISPSKLVALYVISDILSSSSTSGVRHAWRYRQQFEAALKKKKVFSHLRQLEKQLGWGRLRAEKWKRSINIVLNLWESWCVFGQENQADFSAEINLVSLSIKDEVMESKGEGEPTKQGLFTGKWKAVQKGSDTTTRRSGMQTNEGQVDEEDLDGQPMPEDEADEDIDGVPMADSSDEEEHDSGSFPREQQNNGDTDIPLHDQPQLEQGTGTTSADSTAERRALLAASIASRLAKSQPQAPKTIQSTVLPPEIDAPPSVVRKRQRPRAEDMFASDGE